MGKADPECQPSDPIGSDLYAKEHAGPKVARPRMSRRPGEMPLLESDAPIAERGAEDAAAAYGMYWPPLISTIWPVT